MCYWCRRVPYFSQFRSTTSRFRDTDPFETSTPNEPKMTLNPTRSWVHDIHVCVTSLPESQIIPVRFALRPGIFELQASLEQVHFE